MTKKELIESIHNKTKAKRVDIKTIIETMIEIIQDELLQHGNKVNLSGLGTFSVKEYSSRKGFNIHTRKHITIPPKHRVKFRPCNKLVIPEQEQIYKEGDTAFLVDMSWTCDNKCEGYMYRVIIKNVYPTHLKVELQPDEEIYPLSPHARLTVKTNMLYKTEEEAREACKKLTEKLRR